MKPLTLELQAFGPYLERQFIDFTQLTRSGIFLVHGKTGAGKSSILDALVFCLYGKSSVEDKSNDMFRSQYAGPSEKTEVQLDFQLGHRVFRIRRTLEEHRKRSGEVELKETVSLAARSPEPTSGEASWEIIGAGRLSDTAQAISRILGLDAEQFQKVVVLPQGRFRELLVASSSEKEKILASLFGTERFNQLLESAKDLKKQAEMTLSEMNAARRGTLEGLGIGDDTILGEMITSQEQRLLALRVRESSAREDLQVAQDALAAARRLHEDYREWQGLEESRTKLLAKLPAIEADEKRLKQAQAVRELAVYLNQEQLLGQILLKLDDERREVASLIDGLKQAVPQAELELKVAQQDLGNFTAGEAKRLEDLRVIDVDLKDRERARSLIAQAERALPGLQGAVRTSTAELDALDAALADHVRAQNQHKHLENRLIALRGLFAQLKPIEKTSKDLDAETIRLQEIKEQWRTQSNLHHSIQEELRASQAILDSWEAAVLDQTAVNLAGSLHEGSPCPVCGSLDHPHPAQTSPGSFVPPQNELETLRAQLRQMHMSQAQAKAAMEQAKDAITHQEARCQTLSMRLVSEGQDWSTQALEIIVGFEPLHLPDELKSDWSILAGKTSLHPEPEIKAMLTKIGQGLKIYTETKSPPLLRSSDRPELAARLSKETAELQRQQWELERAMDELTTCNDRLNQAAILDQGALDKAREDLRTQRDIHETRLENIRAKLDADKQHLSASEAKYRGIIEALEARNQEGVNLAENITLALKKHEIADRETARSWALPAEEVDHISRTSIQFREELASTEKRHGILSARLKDLVLPELENLEAQGQNLAQELRRLDQEMAVLEEKLNASRKAYEKINELEAAISKHLEHLEDLKRIAAVIGGNNDARVSLQRYALSVYLDEVLEEANGRFGIMTEGRYQLRRIEEIIDGRKGVGLDLEVLDEYTGMSRPVQSLSGGESFMAALSLALGLSDVVQANSGGTNLDTLFVDEGFGSLDEEALQGAIGILERLGQGGRCLGIISHVKELQERIRTRVYVDKGRRGSVIQVM